MNGEFQSIGYGQRGFNEGVYAARAEEDKIYFEAETVNPKQGKINGVESFMEIPLKWITAGAKRVGLAIQKKTIRLMGH